jgi:two-component system NtrC family sensor kinase
MCELLESTGETSIDRLLDFALAADGGVRAVFVVAAPGDVFLPLAVRPDARTGSRPLVMPADVLTDALEDGIPSLSRCDGAAAPVRAVLIVPVGDRNAPTGAVCLESSRTAEEIGTEGLEDLAALALAAAGALARGRAGRASAETERLTTIGRTMAGVAHDIKNLMTGMRTGAYFLEDHLASHERPQLRDSWALLRESQRSVEALVGDLVAFSRPLTLDPVPTALAPVLSRAVDLSRGRAEAREVSLEADLGATSDVPADAEALERCLLNLLANAIEAAPAGTGRVRVRLDSADEEARIEIEDNGPGVPAGDRARVFDLHFTTKGVRGSGFGLAIARSIVEGHGGTIALETPAGTGATFVIRLPREGRWPGLDQVPGL